MPSRQTPHRTNGFQRADIRSPKPLASRWFAPPETQEIASPSHESPVTENLLTNIPVLNPDPNPQLPLQPKLTIGAVGDKYEQEADRVAKEVVHRLSFSDGDRSLPNQNLQRNVEPDNEELKMKPLLQRQGGGAVAASDDLETAIQQSRGGGQPLANSIREPMEQAFGGVDFSGVTVHTDAQSDQLNQSIQAKAFTTGRDIFFRQGAYEPASHEGQQLIAHELTHVIQQSGDSLQKQPDTVALGRKETRTEYDNARHDQVIARAKDEMAVGRTPTYGESQQIQVMSPTQAIGQAMTSPPQVTRTGDEATNDASTKQELAVAGEGYCDKDEKAQIGTRIRQEESSKEVKINSHKNTLAPVVVANSTANANRGEVVQRAWMQTEGGTELQWDRVHQGLRWRTDEGSDPQYYAYTREDEDQAMATYGEDIGKFEDGWWTLTDTIQLGESKQWPDFPPEALIILESNKIARKTALSHYASVNPSSFLAWMIDDLTNDEERELKSGDIIEHVENCQEIINTECANLGFASTDVKVISEIFLKAGTKDEAYDIFTTSELKSSEAPPQAESKEQATATLGELSEIMKNSGKNVSVQEYADVPVFYHVGGASKVYKRIYINTTVAGVKPVFKKLAETCLKQEDVAGKMATVAEAARRCETIVLYIADRDDTKKAEKTYQSVMEAIKAIYADKQMNEYFVEERLPMTEPIAEIRGVSTASDPPNKEIKAQYDNADREEILESVLTWNDHYRTVAPLTFSESRSWLIWLSREDVLGQIIYDEKRQAKRAMYERVSHAFVERIRDRYTDAGIDPKQAWNMDASKVKLSAYRNPSSTP